jgi:uncharacterized protein
VQEPSLYLAGDLKWVIQAPFLTRQIPQPALWELPQSRDLIIQLENDPSLLQTYLKSLKRHNLGSYFEGLVYFWLEQLDDVNVIGTNLQVRDKIKTYGEIDVLFNYRGCLYHWELSVKYYACLNNPTEEQNWVGPLKKDNLKRKMDRLFDHQLPLPYQPYSQGLMKTLGLADKKAQSYPFVKGRLFWDNRAGCRANNLPNRINPAGQFSTWTDLTNHLTIIPEDTEFYTILPKERWFSTANLDDWVAYDDIGLQKACLATFENHLAPFQIILSQKNGSEIIEISRHFMMPDHWAELPNLS